MRPSLQIDSHTVGDTCRVELSGVVDEQADLSPLTALTGRVELHLRGVRRINSAGVNKWLDTVQRLEAQAALVVEECSPALVVQLNMIAGLMGHATVASFYAPMYCAGCGHEDEHLFTTSECLELGRLPPVSCRVCGARLQLDEPEGRYLYFLCELRPIGAS